MQSKAIAMGVSPLEVMLDNMRFAHEVAGKILNDIIAESQGRIHQENDDKTPLNRKIQEMLRYRDIAQNCAVQAAPYVHSKLAQITVKPERADDENKLVIEGGLPQRDRFSEDEARGIVEGTIVESSDED